MICHQYQDGDGDGDGDGDVHDDYARFVLRNGLVFDQDRGCGTRNEKVESHSLSGLGYE